MTLPFPSLDAPWGNQIKKPRILVLEVRDPKEPYEAMQGYLIVEREEKSSLHDNIVSSASITLHYQRILPEKSRWDGGRESFSASYSKASNAVSITSAFMGEGAIYLGISGLHGHRIGTYLMNEIIQWAKQWPTATLVQLHLSENDGYEENKERRNRFYEQFGIKFRYSNDERKSGTSLPMPVDDLIEVDTWKKNISEHCIQEFIAGLLSENRKEKYNIQALQRANEFWRERLREAEWTPFRWALQMLLGRYKFYMIGILVAVVVVHRVWEQAKAYFS